MQGSLPQEFDDIILSSWSSILLLTGEGSTPHNSKIY